MNTIANTNIAFDIGLTIISFEDNYKQQCSLQKSNAALENKIWLGVDKDINLKAVNARMYLTQERVKHLLPHLQKFVEAGELI